MRTLHDLPLNELRKYLAEATRTMGSDSKASRIYRRVIAEKEEQAKRAVASPEPNGEIATARAAHD